LENDLKDVLDAILKIEAEDARLDGKHDIDREMKEPT